MWNWNPDFLNVFFLLLFVETRSTNNGKKMNQIFFSFNHHGSSFIFSLIHLFFHPKKKTKIWCSKRMNEYFVITKIQCRRCPRSLNYHHHHDMIESNTTNQIKFPTYNPFFFLMGKLIQHKSYWTTNNAIEKNDWSRWSSLSL